jgi:uncharacterized phage protein (TIGR02220 family)
MSRPSFQFYHGDWISNAKLRRCTHEEKGVWIDILCLMADSDEFGVIRWPLKDLAQAVGAKQSILHSLIRKGVLKGADEQQTCEAFVYVPRSGRKDGDPVTLVDEQEGPIWYSSKQVRDDHVARARAAYARTQGGITQTPKAAPIPPFGDGTGDVLPSPSPSPSPSSSKALSGKPDLAARERTQQAKAVIDFLNAKTGKNYQHVDANLKLVCSRLKEGATVDDCRAVIANRFRKWNGDPKMEQYLRPATLFNATNFAQYRGELTDASPQELPGMPSQNPIRLDELSMRLASKFAAQ